MQAVAGRWTARLGMKMFHTVNSYLIENITIIILKLLPHIIKTPEEGMSLPYLE